MADRGELQNAKTLLTPLINSALSAEALKLLVLIQYELQEFSQCEATSERLIASHPSSVPPEIFLQLAKLKMRLGKTEAARTVLQTAISHHPDAAWLVCRRAALLEDKAQACAELETHLATHTLQPGAVSEILKEITLNRAVLRRREQELPLSFGISWADTCNWPDQNGLEQLRDALSRELASPKPRIIGLVDLACIAIAQQDWSRAAGLMDLLRKSVRKKKGIFADYLSFASGLHDELGRHTDDIIASGLPPVEHILSQPYRGDTTLFLASDPKYFQHFTIPFLNALEDANIPLDAHVHIFDVSEVEKSTLQQALTKFRTVAIALSVENAAAKMRGLDYARIYYHAVRFIRFYEELRRTRRRTWIMDVDVHLLRDPRELLSGLMHYDAAFQSTPLNFDPAHKIRANCVGISPTSRGLEFARRVAAYISYWRIDDLWGWGIDQTALFACYAHMHASGNAPNTLFLDNTQVCMLGETSGVFQFPTSWTKWSEN